VLTVSNFRAKKQCSLGGPGNRYWLSNHAGHNNIQKNQQAWHRWKIFVTIPTRNFVRKLRWHNHFNEVCKKDMIAKKCCRWWPSSHLGATCPKIHCWRCLKHHHRASHCELSNVSRGSKFEKSDRHRKWIRDCFRPFWMERMKECYSMDGGAADLAIRGVCRCASLSYTESKYRPLLF